MTKILLVDDDPDFRTILKKSLTAKGYEVITAGDGVRGLQAVMDLPLDLILLDLHMPHRDGLETLRLIRAVQAQAKIMILTGYVSEAEQVEARKWGVSDVMLKPITMKLLIDTIGERLAAPHGDHQ
jgi:two-component system, OmpR family, KDP operon response regulator KdpE